MFQVTSYVSYELHEVCTVSDVVTGSWQQSYVKYIMFGRCAVR